MKILLSFLVCCLISCSHEKSSASYTYNLEATGAIKSYELESDVRYDAS